MFVESRYTNIYWQLVERARTREKPTVVEVHHVIPRALGGSDNDSNLVSLTPKEHFFAHHLLTRMVDGQQAWKMNHAFLMMASRRNNRINSSTYHKLKTKTPTWNKGLPMPTEQREKISAKMKGKRAWNKNRSNPQAAINGKKSAAKLSEMYKGRKRLYKEDGTFTYVYPNRE